MTSRGPEADSSGLLIRIWYEPDAPHHRVRARLLALHGADPVPVAAFADEDELAAAVQRWVQEECRAMRDVPRTPPSRP